MRIIFFGTGEFAVPALKALLQSAHEVVAVVSQPDAKKGRGMNVMATPVKSFAEQFSPGLEILQPEKAHERWFIERLKTKDADIFVVVDYGQILIKEVLDIPKRFCVNLHPSLLPKYRGASPVNWAIMNGEKETGNTIIRMDPRMDAGDIILQTKTAIRAEEDADSLLGRLSRDGAELLLKAVGMIASGKAEFTTQEETAATYAPKLRKKDGKIDWRDTANHILRRIKGMQPWPGAYTTLDGKILKIYEGRVVPDGDPLAEAGTVLDPKRFIIRAGKECVELFVVQIEGKKKMTREEFLRGFRLKAGMVLPS